MTIKCSGCIRRWTFEGLGLLWVMPVMCSMCYDYGRVHWMISRLCNEPSRISFDHGTSTSFIGKYSYRWQSNYLPPLAEDIWTNASTFIWWYQDYGRPYFIIIAVWAAYGASIYFTSDDQHYEYWYCPNGCIIVSWCLLVYYFLALLFFACLMTLSRSCCYLLLIE